MSAFYGSVKGNRGEATRGGSKKSGFKVSAQSWEGSVITNMYYDEAALKIRIDLADDSRGTFGDTYFSGTLSELKECFNNYKQLQEARYEEAKYYEEHREYFENSINQ